MKITSPWVRKDTDLDMHFDCEFVDGPDGFSFISIGAVLVSNRKTSTFYGIDTDFFSSSVFRKIVHANNTQNSWMMDNVFRHITGTLEYDNEAHEEGSVKELRDLMQKNLKYQFRPGLDQKYVVMNGDKEGDLEEPDIVVVGKSKNIASELMHAARMNINGKDNLQTIRLFCYYGAYDQYALCRLWGGMMDAPEIINHMNYDIRSIGDAFGYSHDEFNDTTPHHALSDAMVQYGMMRRMRNRIVKEHGTRLGLGDADIKIEW